MRRNWVRGKQQFGSAHRVHYVNPGKKPRIEFLHENCCACRIYTPETCNHVRHSSTQERLRKIFSSRVSGLWRRTCVTGREDCQLQFLNCIIPKAIAVKQARMLCTVVTSCYEQT